MYTIVEIISIQKGSEDFWSGGGSKNLGGTRLHLFWLVPRVEEN
jgi:hypothetical protein